MTGWWMKISIDPSDAIHCIIQPHLPLVDTPRAVPSAAPGSAPASLMRGVSAVFLKGADGVARARINSPRAMTTLLPELPRVVLLVRGFSQARVVRRG